MNLYPFKMAPTFQTRPWGGRAMKDRLGKNIPDGTIGESWEVSVHPNGLSRVANGPFAGQTLKDLVGQWGERLIGKAVADRYGGDFPLLIKVLDINALASVQVHPDNAQAQALEQFPYGKAEAWCFLAVGPEAECYCGFQPGVTAADYDRAVVEGNVKALLRPMTIATGDWLYLPPGTVHAAGNGILLLEVQQNCDLTYRVYDWNRTDSQGRQRELHLDKARQVIDFASRPQLRRAAGLANCLNPVLDGPYFSIGEVVVASEFALPSVDAAVVGTVIGGTVALVSAQESFPLATGDSFLVPANLDGRLVGENSRVVLSQLV
jgi:mannose-6-phosphate isomerase